MNINIAFAYLYRDASNYKNGGRVVFSNPEQHSLQDVKARLLPSLRDEEYFIASQIGVPDAFLWDTDADYDPDDESTYPADLGAGKYKVNDDDHCWHEFDDLFETDLEPTDPRTLAEFMAAVEQASQAGWQEFVVRGDQSSDQSCEGAYLRSE